MHICHFHCSSETPKELGIVAILQLAWLLHCSLEELNESFGVTSTCSSASMYSAVGLAWHGMLSASTFYGGR